MNPLVGKIVRAVFLASDGGAIRFDLDGGESLVVRADGDCCSHSWIAELQGIDQLLDSPVVSVEDIAMPGGTDELQCYGCRLTTEKGFAVIDYRNESNGYYGGNLSWPGEYFYGGVFGQNVSTLEWQSVSA